MHDKNFHFGKIKWYESRDKIGSRLTLDTSFKIWSSVQRSPINDFHKPRSFKTLDFNETLLALHCTKSRKTSAKAERLQSVYELNTQQNEFAG